jgi:DNA-directed RNA polymerase omega subunit
MPTFNQAPDSQFAYVVVAGKRARQLMSGASPLVANPRSHKPTRVAMEELNAAQLEYKTPEPPAGAADKDKDKDKRHKE